MVELGADMKMRSKHFGRVPDFTYIAGIRNKLSFSIDIGRLDVVNFSQVLV